MWRSNLSFSTSFLRLDLLMSSANIFFCFLSILYFTLQLYAIHRLTKQNLTPHFLALIGYICATLRFDSLSLRSCGLNRASLRYASLFYVRIRLSYALLYFTILDLALLSTTHVCSTPVCFTPLCWDVTLLCLTKQSSTLVDCTLLGWALLY